jgi:predicted phage terminase large subunit-like protein
MSKPLKQKVEEWLRQVNYDVDGSYIPEDFALEFVNFIKLVNGVEGESHKTPVVHYHMLDNISGLKRNTINLCHRGMAKTTLLGEYLFLYIGCYGEIPGFGKVPLAIYVSDSIENGVKNMRKNLEYRWENSEFLQFYVPNIRFTDTRWEFKNLDGNRFIVKGYGAKTGVRGAKELGVRPVLAVLDDLISDEDAKSPTVIENVEATVFKAVKYALDPTRSKTIWSGTPFNAKDPLYKAVESGAWYVNVYPVCEKFPCTREEFKGSWPDRFGFDYVQEMYDDAVLGGMINTFNQELMLRIMSDEDRLISDHDIRWYSRANLLTNKGKFNFYITTDFATSERASSDFSTISVWAYNANGDWFWVDGICIRQDMGKNMDDLFRLAQMYKPQQVGIEVSGQQGGFIPWIKREMMDRNQWFTLASENNNAKEGIRPTTNKMQRFNVVVPWIKSGKLYLPEDTKTHPAVVELLEELSLASAAGFRSKHDDMIDTVSMLASLTAWRPTEDIQATEKDDGMWEFDEDEDRSHMQSYLV